jgi:hypothetical protein
VIDVHTIIGNTALSIKPVYGRLPAQATTIRLADVGLFCRWDAVENRHRASAIPDPENGSFQGSNIFKIN